MLCEKQVFFWILSLIDFPKKFLSKRFPKRVKDFLKPLYFPNIIYNIFYKKNLKEFFSEIIKKHDLVFDIGANIGIFSEVFIKLNAKVVAVEPQPKLVGIMKRKFKNNKRINIFENGVSSKKGILIFYMNKKDLASSTFLKDWSEDERFLDGDWSRNIKVKVITLSDLIKKFGIPKYIKIDVEGFEEKVLMGLNRSPAYISFEFTKQFQNFLPGKKCIKILQKINKNYLFNYTTSEYYEFKLHKWVSSRDIILEIENNPKNKLVGEIFAKLS